MAQGGHGISLGQCHRGPHRSQSGVWCVADVHVLYSLSSGESGRELTIGVDLARHEVHAASSVACSAEVAPHNIVVCIHVRYERPSVGTLPSSELLLIMTHRPINIASYRSKAFQTFRMKLVIVLALVGVASGLGQFGPVWERVVRACVWDPLNPLDL